ncbi:MAG: filamentous hemagglutinin N-terminal domain-containing protein [Pararobbsia sp.]
MKHRWKHFASRWRVAVWAPIVMSAGMTTAAPARAQLTPDPEDRNPQRIGAASNGVPLIDIKTPTPAGVSYNPYETFGVGERGAILNNAMETVPTELGGFVPPNPNLKTEPARIIVNEVTGELPSTLNGYLEVAGPRAEVVVANPNGITCSSCGFINAERGTLTTGRLAWTGGGDLEALRVTGGEIEINRLIATNLPRLDVSARSIRVTGEVQGLEVSMTSGPNEIEYARRGGPPQKIRDGIKEIAGVGKAPRLGVDVAKLGGVYAHKIRVISAEYDMPLQVEGKLAASKGDLVLSSAGALVMRGKLSARDKLHVHAVGSIFNYGELSAAGMTRLVSDQGEIDLGVSVVNGGRFMGISTPTFLRNFHGRIQADRIDVRAKSFQNRSGLVAATGHLTFHGEDLDNRQASMQAGDLVVSATGKVLNTMGILRGADAIQVRSQNLDNNGGQISGDRDVSIRGGVLDNTHGHIGAAKVLEIRSDEFRNPYGHARGEQALDIESQTVNNLGGELSSSMVPGGAVSMAADRFEGGGRFRADALNLRLGGDYTHTADRRFDTRSLSISATGTLQNHGELHGREKTYLSANDFVNGPTGTTDGRHVYVNVAGTLRNEGRIYGDNVSVSAYEVINDGGNASAAVGCAEPACMRILQGDGSVQRIGAVMAGRETLQFAASRIDNRGHGLLFSNGRIGITGRAQGKDTEGSADEVINQGSMIRSLGDLSIDARHIRNLNPVLQTQTTVVVADERIVEYQPLNSSQRFNEKTVKWREENGAPILVLPDGTEVEDYTRYEYQYKTSDVSISAGDQAHLVSGGNMKLNGDVVNDKSRIVADRKITQDGASGTAFHNIDASGQRIVAKVGTSMFSHVELCGVFGRSRCRFDEAALAYEPAPDVSWHPLGAVTVVDGWKPAVDEPGSATSQPGGSVAEPAPGQGVAGTTGTGAGGESGPGPAPAPIAEALSPGLDESGLPGVIPVGSVSPVGTPGSAPEPGPIAEALSPRPGESGLPGVIPVGSVTPVGAPGSAPESGPIAEALSPRPGESGLPGVIPVGSVSPVGAPGPAPEPGPIAEALSPRPGESGLPGVIPVGSVSPVGTPGSAPEPGPIAEALSPRPGESGLPGVIPVGSVTPVGAPGSASESGPIAEALSPRPGESGLPGVIPVGSVSPVGAPGPAPEPGPIAEALSPRPGESGLPGVIPVGSVTPVGAPGSASESGPIAEALSPGLDESGFPGAISVGSVTPVGAPGPAPEPGPIAEALSPRPGESGLPGVIPVGSVSPVGAPGSAPESGPIAEALSPRPGESGLPGVIPVGSVSPVGAPGSAPESGPIAEALSPRPGESGLPGVIPVGSVSPVGAPGSAPESGPIAEALSPRPGESGLPGVIPVGSVSPVGAPGSAPEPGPIAEALFPRPGEPGLPGVIPVGSVSPVGAPGSAPEPGPIAEALFPRPGEPGLPGVISVGSVSPVGTPGSAPEPGPIAGPLSPRPDESGLPGAIPVGSVSPAGTSARPGKDVERVDVGLPLPLPAAPAGSPPAWTSWTNVGGLASFSGSFTWLESLLPSSLAAHLRIFIDHPFAPPELKPDTTIKQVSDAFIEQERLGDQLLPCRNLRARLEDRYGPGSASVTDSTAPAAGCALFSARDGDPVEDATRTAPRSM